VRIQVIFERNTSCNLAVSGGDGLCLLHIFYPAELQKHMYLSLDIHVCEKMQHLAHYIPLRIALVFERNTSCKSFFSRWR
jgi:hypothetical protein